MDLKFNFGYEGNKYYWPIAPINTEVINNDTEVINNEIEVVNNEILENRFAYPMEPIIKGLISIGYYIEKETKIQLNNKKSYLNEKPNLNTYHYPNSLGTRMEQTYVIGTFDDAGLSVQCTTDGGYILTGYTEDYQNDKVFLIKTDENGNQLCYEFSKRC